MTAITELSSIYADYVDKNRQDRMIVSIRDYDQVRAGLRLPSSLLVPGGKVVSVGEGLTDFARTARDRFGTDITAVDPIYSVITDEMPV